ncbi:MAG: adaptor protein MecA [Lachnospiraceae bacterium]|nr:adaptor protein MecA [Lachnospiraceae bacterium]
MLKGIYHGENRLYKNPDTTQYHLVITKSDHTPEEFNKV